MDMCRCEADYILGMYLWEISPEAHLYSVLVDA